jgi:hypothetical protein
MTGVAIDWIALNIRMVAWDQDIGEMRTTCYRTVKDVFFWRVSPHFYNYRSLPGSDGEDIISALEG